MWRSAYGMQCESRGWTLIHVSEISRLGTPGELRSLREASSILIWARRPLAAAIQVTRFLESNPFNPQGMDKVSVTWTA